MGLGFRASLFAIALGIILIVIACIIAFVNVGMTRDQLNQGDAMNQIFGDYFYRYGVAFVLTIIGTISVGIGYRGFRQ